MGAEEIITKKKKLGDFLMDDHAAGRICASEAFHVDPWPNYDVELAEGLKYAC